MNNAEKFKEIFKEFATEVWAFPEKDFLTWLNAEYKEPTTKNDCKHCSKTYGTLGCCDTVNNEWVYSCKEGHEEYARGIRKLGTTTKNDLGVDCILRADARHLIAESFRKNLLGMTFNKMFETLYKGIDDLPSVTPQEPQTFKWCTDCKEYDQAKHCCHRWSKVIRNTVEEMKQEPKTGHWIDINGIYAKCSNCNEEIYITGDFKYCPNCGAKMESER